MDNKNNEYYDNKNYYISSNYSNVSVDDIREIKNAKGKRLLEKTILDYSLEIIDKIKENPEIIDMLLENLQITREDLYKYLSGVYNANITFYDEALSESYEFMKKGK